MKRGSCDVCHEVPGLPEASRTDSCHSCHVWIHEVSAKPSARKKAMAIFPHWERYERNVVSYMEVPSLASARARLEPGWVATWLADPHDLRPGLPETMPRFALTEAEREAIAGWFAEGQQPVPSTLEPSPERLPQGAELFVSQGCSACHSYGALHTGGVPMAPDLAHTRARMDPDRLAAWIADPKGMAPETVMPTLELSEEQVLALRDYVLLAEPGWTPAPALDTRVAATTEPVTWEQVDERVFGRICAHCHMKPELNDGRAGPGNAGGFGFAATGIELQTYEGVASVADRIPATLERRRLEVHRDVVAPGQQPASLERPERPGMPLGLPALSDEDTALVLGWIEQGMPR
jgi:mono/diheme cytochrome c family protein